MKKFSFVNDVVKNTMPERTPRHNELIYHEEFSLVEDYRFVDRKVYSINGVLAHIGGLGAVITVLFRLLFKYSKKFKYELSLIK